MKSKKNFKLKTAVIISAIVVFALVAVTAAKYVGKVNENHLQTDYAFEFSSNLLDIDPQIINLYGRDASNDYTFQFELRNWSNRLNISDVNFTANIACNNSSVTFSPSSVNFDQAGTLTTQTVTVTVPAGTVLTNNSITVTASVTKPYSKQIYADFNIYNAESNSTSMLKNYGEYVELHFDVTAGKTYTVTWPEGYSPDNTNPLFENAVNSLATGSGIYTVASQAADGYVTVKFFKTGAVPSGAAVSITEQGGSTVTEIIPSA